MLKASIDLGTNTCLMLLAEVESGQIKNVLGDYSRIIRLGEDVDKTRCLQPKAIDRTLECLSEYRDIVFKSGILPSDAVCVATSHARDASNGEEFFVRVEAESGFKFRIISGKDEARMCFMGSLLPGMEPSLYTVMDIGGGSTEFVTELEDRSIDLGSVRFTERYLKSDPVTETEYSNCLEKIDNKLGSLMEWRGSIHEGSRLLAVAGTATTLASWHLCLKEFDADMIERVELKNKHLRSMVKDLKRMSIAERRDQVGIEPRRADVLLAGAMIMWRSMEKLNFPGCFISTRGLRYGALIKL